MAKLIKEIIVGKYKVKQYDFDKTKIIAGSCPDCIHVVAYHPDLKLFRCRNIECSLTANEDGFVIFSNKLRKQGLKKPIEVPTQKGNDENISVD